MEFRGFRDAQMCISPSRVDKNAIGSGRAAMSRFLITFRMKNDVNLINFASQFRI